MSMSLWIAVSWIPKLSWVVASTGKPNLFTSQRTGAIYNIQVKKLDYACFPVRTSLWNIKLHVLTTTFFSFYWHFAYRFLKPNHLPKACTDQNDYWIFDNVWPIDLSIWSMGQYVQFCQYWRTSSGSFCGRFNTESSTEPLIAAGVSRHCCKFS